jgi:hypothetical protein
MIDRRQMLAAGVALAGVGGAVRAQPRAKGAPARDLTGVWTNGWYTQLERPDEFKTLVITPAEAAAFEAPRRALNGDLLDPHDTLGQATSEFPDQGPGLARIRGEIRSSWIVDPADGKVPWTREGRARLHPRDEPPELFDNVETRPTDERCLTASGAGAPILNSHDTNLVQFVQTADCLAIVSEKNHDARIVRIGGGPLKPGESAPGFGGWMGISTGHWEGATLVVETIGLRPGITKLNDSLSLSDRSRVVERFTRSGPREITYEFRVADPTLFTRPWRAEMVFRPAEGLMYEVACHEGNYALPSILAAARQGNQGEAKGH